MSDKSRTPAKTRFVRTPNPTKSAKKIEESTTPHKYKQPRSIEDEGFPPGFSRIDDIDMREETNWKSVPLETDESDNTEHDIERPGPSGISDSDTSNPDELSVLAEYDDLVTEFDFMVEDDSDLDKYFIDFVSTQQKNHVLWQQSINECKRLQEELDKANHDIGDFANKLNHARKLLDQEKKLRRRAEEERNNLERQMALARDLLFSEQHKNRLPDETREKLAFLNNTTIRSSFDHGGIGTVGSRLNTINEVNSNEMNSTGSLLSDLSYSRSEDDLDSSTLHGRRQWMKHRPAPIIEEPGTKKRRSSSGRVVEINTSDKIVATTTVSVSKDGPITATSVIESIPQEPIQPTPEVLNKSYRESLKEIRTNTQEVIEKIWRTSPYIDNNNVDKPCSLRVHSFVPKAIIRPDTCRPCNKRIGFGRVVVRCKDCRAVCHPECKEKLPLPCIPLINTPTQKGVIGTIADYAPKMSPMVPAIIVHCINEVELRGLSEVGLYRVPGSEKEVKQLKEKFLRGKGAPMLNDIDIHVICGVIKDFLRSLQESLITQGLWKDFISTAEVRDIVDVPPILYGAISKLPQPNRDTLAYLLLHLQKVAESKDCKMPVGNLAKVFGPTVIGYSSQDPDPGIILTETRQQAVVMEYLLSLPNDFWSKFVNVCTPVKSGTMPHTPSTESLLRSGSKGFFATPYSARSTTSIRKQKKFFGTPPYK